MKKCNRCEIEQTDSDFYFDRSHYGPRSICKSCDRSYRKSRYITARPKGLSIEARLDKYIHQCEHGPTCDQCCWPCSLPTAGDRSKYPVMTVNGKTLKVHHLVGGKPPLGQVTRHSCDNTICCNPHHLLHGTALDNSRDMMERGRWRWKNGQHGWAYPD